MHECQVNISDQGILLARRSKYAATQHDKKNKGASTVAEGQRWL